ncbi:hypothetical protein LXL04_005167 [Taraxacum kok-saghyz]
MEQRIATSLIMTVNEKKFIESALLSDIRVDGRHPFDYRTLTITFGSEDGSSEVQLGQTQVIGFVTAQLVQPYRDRPNEGTFAIYTEFSPMADPSFETGRPTDFAIELGRIIDRGLSHLFLHENIRESRAVDTESLCVIAGKLVWSIRIDLHIIDNGGNLVDAANIAALAALSTFRRSECTFGGEDGQELIVHPPHEREPLPLIIHHLPVAVTFGFIGKENIVIIDPTHYEEAIMGGSMTATLNTNGDICAIQKAGGDGVPQSVIMQCLRIASVKAGDITKNINNAVESYNIQRSLRKIKRRDPSSVVIGGEFDDVAKCHMERLSLDESSDDVEIGRKLIENDEIDKRNSTSASWDPYSSGVDADALRASLASRVATPIDTHKEESRQVKVKEMESSKKSSSHEVTKIGLQISQPKTLKDAVKPRHKRRNKLTI